MKNSSKINFFNIDILLLVTTICIQRSIMIVIIQQFNNRSYIDEAYFPNILNPRIKFYNIELRQHQLILILVWTLLLNGRILSQVASTVTRSFNMWPIQIRSNSIKRMINGFVGKFDIDDGIYDSEDFRLVFNSIAATCKATENLSLYQTSACKSSVIQSINRRCRTSFRKIFRRQFEMAITPEFKYPCSYGVPYQKPSHYVPIQLIDAHDPILGSHCAH
ncbi:hypothetical protein BLOT_003163 [Blomia tropicalis]|nr:hypothetical protein BLOT_003163 [Blomia tropicalis]